jgi:hypothetical protein
MPVHIRPFEAALLISYLLERSEQESSRNLRGFLRCAASTVLEPAVGARVSAICFEHAREQAEAALADLRRGIEPES